MGLNLASKTIDKNIISCGEDFLVTLSLSASPSIQDNPVDIVLILDKSGSMTGVPLTEMKTAAKTFIDIIDESTDGGLNGLIGNGSNIGIVSFSTDATKDVGLTTNTNTLKNAIDLITAGGNTNHADAFKKAIELFNPLSQNNKVVIMFTDGTTTIGTDPLIDAELAKSMGITIYCIGLTGANGVDVTALNSWASAPISTHVSIAPNPEDLVGLFEDLASNISKPGATNIVIDEVLNDDFNIIEILPASVGNASLINNTSLRWVINELGKTKDEGAILTFKVSYLGQSSKVTNINKSITYVDTEGNIANFGNPEITINCSKVVIVNPCPEAKNVDFGGCQDYLEYDLGDYSLSDLGRILELSINIKNVCPNKKVAVAITLNEINNLNTEIKKAMKILSIPAHTSTVCEDIKLKNIKFVLPEEDGLLCSERKFVARVLANYINNNPIC